MSSGFSSLPCSGARARKCWPCSSLHVSFADVLIEPPLAVNQVPSSLHFSTLIAVSLSPCDDSEIVGVKSGLCFLIVTPYATPQL